MRSAGTLLSTQLYPQTAKRHDQPRPQIAQGLDSAPVDAQVHDRLGDCVGNAGDDRVRAFSRAAWMVLFR